MAEDIPLTFYQPAGLFLKQDAKICIEVKIPEIKVSGVSISNWEVMEKLKLLSQPEEFQRLRVATYSREKIQFEGEFDSMRALRKVILLLNRKSIKLSGFTDLLKVRATQLEPEFPSKKTWEEYFMDRGMEKFDDGKPGERPDTVHVKGLPVKWFKSASSEDKPCTRILTEAFQKFGKVSQVGIYEIPAPSSSTQSSGDFASFGPGSSQCLHFEAYIQYEKYASFCTAMSSLKGVKMIRLEDGGKEAVASIIVDFDRGAFLSERHMRKRRRAEEKRLKALEEQKRKEEQIKKAKEEKMLAEQKAAEEAKARRKAERLEQKQRRKQQQALLVSQLKEVAVQRREEAQRLLSVLLAGAAEAKLADIIMYRIVWFLSACAYLENGKKYAPKCQLH